MAPGQKDKDSNMKTISSFILMGLLLAVALGCDFVTCADLQEVCDRCSDPNDKDLCQLTADSDNAQGCSNMLALYEDKCP